MNHPQLLLLKVGLAVAGVTVSSAQAAERYWIDIPARVPLAQALTTFSTQTDHEILFKPDLIDGLRAPRVVGRLDVDAGLARLLKGTDLTVRRFDGRLLIERPALAAPRRVIVEPDTRIDLEPVMVTALRRPTLELETPLSMRVLSGADLGRSAIETFDRAAQQLPGLTPTSTGTGRTRLTLRGVYGSGEATTALYYNDVPVSGPSGTTADPGSSFPELLLVDLDRLEVLRGPQGTLYGASAMGGAVKAVFSRPDLATSSLSVAAESHLTAGKTGGGQTLILNHAVRPGKAALRVTAYRREDAAFADNDRLGLPDVNDGLVEGARLGLLVKPGAGLTVRLTLALQDGRVDDTGAASPGQPAHVSRNFVRTPFDSRIAFGATAVEWRGPGVRVTASAARYAWSSTRFIDYTGTLRGERSSAAGCRRYLRLTDGAACDTGQAAVYAGYVDSRSPGLLHQPIDLQADVREVRASSDGGGDGEGFLAWTVGLFDEAREDVIDSQVLVADATTGLPVWSSGFTGRRIVETRLTQRAAFGEVTLGADRDTSLTIGARRFVYDKNTLGRALVVNVISDTSAANFNTSVSERGWSLKVLGSHWFTPDLLGYAQLSQGYRPGGINTAPGLPTSLAAYTADSLWNREIGLKGSWFEARLGLQAALYSVDWQDMQYAAVSTNGAFGFVTNLGRARIDGVELDATWTPEPGLRVGLNLAATAPVLTEDQATGELAGLGSKGDTLPAVPDVSVTTWAEHRRPLGEAMLTLNASAAYIGRSRSTFESTAAASDNQSLGGVLLIDTRATLERGPGALSLFVENLLDSDEPLFVTTGRMPQVHGPRPRRVGISLRLAY